MEFFGMSTVTRAPLRSVLVVCVPGFLALVRRRWSAALVFMGGSVALVLTGFTSLLMDQFPGPVWSALGLSLLFAGHAIGLLARMGSAMERDTLRMEQR